MPHPFTLLPLARTPMPRPVPRVACGGPGRPLLRAAAVSALLLGSALPAAAQVLIYEGQPGLAPRGYPVPPGAYPPAGPYPVPQARYPVLPPAEIRAIVQSMGYWNIGAPKLSGRFYLVAAADQEGRALLRVNAFTGRVVSARTIPGGPAVAAPAPAPQRSAPPAVARAAPPSSSVAGTPAPLPPQRPPEATMAAVTPAPSVAASPAPTTQAPAVTAPAATAPATPVPATPVPAASVAAAPPAPGATSDTPTAGQTAAQQSASAAPTATAAPAQPQKRKAGAGTATTDTAAAGTASVLSRPKSQ